MFRVSQALLIDKKGVLNVANVIHCKIGINEGRRFQLPKLLLFYNSNLILSLFGLLIFIRLLYLHFLKNIL